MFRFNHTKDRTLKFQMSGSGYPRPEIETIDLIQEGLFSEHVSTHEGIVTVLRAEKLNSLDLMGFLQDSRFLEYSLVLVLDHLNTIA